MKQGRLSDNRRRITWTVGRQGVIAAVAAPVAVGLFLLLALGVADGVLVPVDEGVLRALEQVRNGALTVVMRVITFLGGDWGIALPTVTAVVVLVVACRPRSREALFVIAAMVGTGVLQLLTKLVFERPRPTVVAPLVAVNTYSYPSGHAMASAGLALALAVIAWRTRWRAVMVVGGAAFVVLVGISRLYLGVHYPSDVLAGWLLAVAWVASVWLAFDLAGRPVGRRSRGCAAGDQQAVNYADARQGGAPHGGDNDGVTA